jgi:nucleotide-binding universal stress UspA family protein
VNSQVRDSDNTRDSGRILCPIDFDANSLAALDLARDLARLNGGTLYVLHIVRLSERAAAARQNGAPEGNGRSIAPLVTSARSLVERTRQFYFAQLRFDELVRAPLGDVKYRLLLRSGNPAQQILDVAGELNAQMLVMATNCRTRGSQPILGSVAETVIRESPCPVLTVRNPSKFEAGRFGSLVISS